MFTTDGAGCLALRLLRSHKANETVVKKCASSYGLGKVGLPPAASQAGR